MHKDGITMAEYWTELPPKAELEQKLQAALLEARVRLGTGRCWEIWMMSDDMKVNKGLGVPVVALPAKGEDEQEAARVVYVATTQDMQRLVIRVGGDGERDAFGVNN